MSATSKREACFICAAAAPTCGRSPYCLECNAKVLTMRAKAILAVRMAIRRGLLRHPKLCICVDCRKRAFDYDHRDYSKPLAVEPVCRRCNQLRGPALIGAA